jgi:hypothetical protein
MRMINHKANMLRELNCQSLEKPFELETLIDKVVAAIGPPQRKYSAHPRTATRAAGAQRPWSSVAMGAMVAYPSRRYYRLARPLRSAASRD